MCKAFTSSSLSAVWLAVLPNSTILDPSEPKTCPAVLCHRLAGDPSAVCRKSSPFFFFFFFNTGFNELHIPVKFQRSKWRHLLSLRVQQKEGAAVQDSPAKRTVKQSCQWRVLSCSWSGTYFLFS